MVKLKEFRISLDKDVFKPGDALSGFVHLCFDQSTKVKGINLTTDGSALVKWTNDGAFGKRGQRNVFKAVEKYFHFTQSMWRDSENGKESTVPAGRHSLPFRFELPANLPTSFEGKLGYVRYVIKCSITRAMFKADFNTKGAFTVVRTCNLNQMPDAGVPMLMENSKQFHSCCCTAGQVDVNAKTDKSGYVPGETVQVSVDMTNLSARRLLYVMASLKQVVVYTATKSGIFTNNTKKKEDANILKSTEKVKLSSRQGIQPHHELSLPLPALPESKLEGCKYMDIFYSIVVRVWYSANWSSKKFVKVNLPITIGNVPLIVEAPTFTLTPFIFSSPGPQQAAPAQPSAPPIESQVSQTPTAPPAEEEFTAPISVGLDFPGETLAPPSYDSVFGPVSIRDDEDNEETYGNLQFAPRYSFFTMRRRQQNQNNQET